MQLREIENGLRREIEAVKSGFDVLGSVYDACRALYQCS